MANSYEVLIYNPARTQVIARLQDFAVCDYVLNDNAAGAMTLVIPPIISPSLLTADTQIEIWRIGDGQAPVLEGNAQWFVERVTTQYAAERLITIAAVDAMGLLARRNVMYYAGSNQTNMTGPADDLMKAIMRQNFPDAPPLTGRVTGGFGGTEIFTGDLLSIAGDVSLLPSVQKAFSWADVLGVLQDLAEMSFGEGTYGAFRMVQVDPDTGALQFRTYSGSYGPDRRAAISGQAVPSGVTLTPENGSIVNGLIVEDWSDTATNVVAGGEGEGSGRALGSAVKRAPSAWGYRERFVENTNTNSIATLNNYAAGKLQELQPMRTITGTINETADVRYGREFGLGYLVTANIGGFTVDARVRQVHVTMTQDEGETITAEIINESTIA